VFTTSIIMVRILLITLMMEAVSMSEMSVSFFEATCCNI
jgi:hypothetical protein